MTELSGAVSVVTGGASGIGRATATALAREGSAVVVADIDIEGARAVADAIDGLAFEVDVSDREQVEELVRRSIEWKGHCDVFVSNAGIGCHGGPHEFTHDEWAKIIDTNLSSCIWPLRTLLPHMLGRGSGHLAFVSSGAGFEGFPDRAPYCVTKFGIVGLAESVARYLIGSGVHVTLVVPGAIASDGWKRSVVAQGNEHLHEQLREASGNWPAPETFAPQIVEAIAENRYFVAQYNPYEPDWLRNVLERKGRDPEGFITA